MRSRSAIVTAIAAIVLASLSSRGARADEPAAPERSAPAAALPTAPSPAPGASPAAERETAPVRFEGNEEGVTVLARRAGATPSDSVVSGAHVGAYTSVCYAPCDVSVPVGAHRFALAARDGSPIEADDPVVISGPSNVIGTFHRTRRRVGWVTFGVGLGVGALVMVTSLRRSSECTMLCMNWDANAVQLGIGAGVTVASVVVGLALALKHDTVTFDVLPLEASPLPGRREGLAAPEGITLRARF